mgnify:CR=1 FL=1
MVVVMNMVMLIMVIMGDGGSDECGDDDNGDDG